MKNTVVFIGIFGAFLACNNKKEEVVNFDEIAPQSELYGDDKNQINESVEIDSLEEVKLMFNNSPVEFDEISIDVRTKFPERFGPEKTEKYILTGVGDTIFYSRWVYNDSLRTLNAFYNWIDCFTDKCKSFYVGQEVSAQQNAFKIMVYDTVLIHIESTGDINFAQWDDFHDSLNYDKLNCKLILEQRRRGRTKWFEIDENENKIPYEE